MTSILLSHHCNWSFQEHCFKERFDRVPCSRYSGLHLPSSGLIFVQGPYLAICHRRRRARKYWPPFCDAVDDRMNSDDPEDENDGKESSKGESGGVNSEMIRKNLEKIVGKDDSGFSGLDLATLIRNKYGKSYDVQLIKKEFMGRNLLALNVMWKYMEQRSFPLTEEEYILRLDDVANTLKCWGAVSHIRSSLEKSKERPRIGKAVSIFIDMDESGGRANEWIYK